jgi:hypothetical protein
MKVSTFDELLPLYVRARQKLRNQRNELQALNKVIKWEQLNRVVLYNDIERFRRLWDDERKRKMPRAPIVEKRSILPPLLVGLVFGFILGQLFWFATR